MSPVVPRPFSALPAALAARDGEPGRIVRLSRNVRHLARATAFYEARLGFARSGSPVPLDPALARLWGRADVPLVRQRLRLGASELELVDVGGVPGAPYPEDRRADDLAFQHFAIRCADLDQAFSTLYRHDPALDAPHAISHDADGMPRPIALPARSGGVTAFKFRDPDGHPVELLGLPDRSDATAHVSAHAASSGIDHSAISVSNAVASIRFYRHWLGFTVDARQRNTGAEQDRLDGLRGARVDVVTLRTPSGRAPHLELLGYHGAPRVRPPGADGPSDVASDRLVIRVADLDALRQAWTAAGLPIEASTADALLVRDPDRHLLMLTR